MSLSGILRTPNGNTVVAIKGTTTGANNYLGYPGEIVADMGPVANAAPYNWTLRVMNGVVPGGTVLATNNALNTVRTSLNSTISSVSALQANVVVLQANAAAQAVEINSLRANITAANAVITSLGGNAAVQGALLDTLTSNAAAQALTLDILNSNAATQAFTLTVLLGNAVSQQTSLADLVANAAAQAELIANIGGGGGGNIVVDNSQINFVANSSGDGVGYSTIELRPDTDATQDQYIIIDPTEPSHIHIRAGGQQDDSLAELYLGGERNYVRVIDGDGVRLQSEILDDTYYYYSDTAEFTLGSWYEDSGTYYVEYTTTNNSMQDRTFDFTNDTDNNQLIVYYSGGTSNTLTSAGSASNLGGNVYRVSVNEAPPTNPLSLEQIEFRIFESRTSYIEIENNDIQISADDDLRIYSHDAFRLYNYSSDEPIEIITNYDDDEHTWEFRADGTLTTPGDITVSGDITGTSGADTLVLKAQPDSNTSIQLNNTVDSTISTVANLEISTDVANTAQAWRFDTNGDLTVPNYIYFKDGTFIGDEGGAGTPVFRVDAPLGLGIDLTTDSDISGNNYTWSFGIDGNLTLPANGTINYSNGVNILDSISGTYGNAQVAEYLANFDGVINFVASPAIINTGEITAANVSSTNGFFWGNGTPYSTGSMGDLTITGNVTQDGAYYETYANVSNSGGNLTCNLVDGGTFYVTLGANVTANFVNVADVTGTAVGATIIVDQGVTPYSVSNVQINGGAVQTVRWASGTVNTGTASNTDIMSFSLINLGGGQWRILGQISNYA